MDRVAQLLAEGVTQGVYPGAVLHVARGDEVVFFDAVGSSSLIPQVVPMKKDTIFDLASLTKPLATALAVGKLVDQYGLDLDAPLEALLSREFPKDKKALTPRLLLCHCSGLASWAPFYLNLTRYQPAQRKKVVRDWIIEKPLAYLPGTESCYSDLGFMVLEWVIEEVLHMPMHVFLWRSLYEPLLLEKTFLGGTAPADRFEKTQFAATEACPWRNRLVWGEVHDENASALGGYSGHSGLFGTAEDVYAIADMLKGHFRGGRQDCFRPQTVRSLFTRQYVTNGATYALGWDTPAAENSSAGRYFSRESVGHLGFTGTSVWMDPVRDIIIIFLTNRIHPSRHNEKIKAFRPKIHDAVMEALGAATEKGPHWAL